MSGGMPVSFLVRHLTDNYAADTVVEDTMIEEARQTWAEEA